MKTNQFFTGVAIVVILFLNNGFTFPSEKNEKIYSFLEAQTKPHFQYNNLSLQGYIANAISYPSPAKSYDVEGTLKVQFIIEKNGKIRNPKVIQSLGYGCDKAVLQMLRKMPNWKPGMLNGEPIRVSYILPLKFIL